jgi:metal-responsive CopG/Arc/MetJ family transcriptional regulator
VGGAPRLVGMKMGIILGMKTAISIDDGLLQEADDTARRLGVSRSRLFALAVGDFLARQRQEQMLARLNKVYAGPAESETRLLKGMRSKMHRTLKERW